MQRQYDDFDIVVSIDMDMAYGIDIRGILHTFSKADNWDMVCSNGISNAKGEMYDAFAFRNDEFPENQDTCLKNTGIAYWDDYIKKIQKVYPVDSEMVKVKSCFGGLAIYKKRLFNDCRYDSINNDCEHIYLHQCMINKHNARLFMNPTQVIRYEHYEE